MSKRMNEKQSNTERFKTMSQEAKDLLTTNMDTFEAEKHKQRSRTNLDQAWPLYRDLLKFLSRLTYISSDKLNNYVRTLTHLILLGLIFPFNLFVTLFTIIFSNLMNLMKQKYSISKTNSNSKRILVSGGMMSKALQLCRALHQAGHHVILVDDPINWLTGHQWSNSVERFYIVPSPEKDPKAYINKLADIVQKEKIDMFIPVTGPYHAHIDAQAEAPLAAHGCSTFHMTIDEIALLDNKYTFADKARSLGLAVPKSFLITSGQQLLDFNFENKDRFYICKRIMYDWLDRGQVIKLPQSTRVKTIEYINQLPVSEECPYILQEFIQGDEYCTHGTCMDGELTLFACCHSSAWQLNYKHIEHPAILEWCATYVRALKLTGHASFDFIVSVDDGKAYGIECNPRIHSAITAFYNHPNVADAYIQPGPSKPMIPLSTARETYWLTHELWRMITNIGSMKKLSQSLKTIFKGKEAIWSWDDPLPFLLHYHVHIAYLLLDNLRPSRARFFNKIDCCIGELA